jgi:hypothetical protein
MNCCQVADILGDAPRTVAYWVERFEQKGLGGASAVLKTGQIVRFENPMLRGRFLQRFRQNYSSGWWDFLRL